MNQSDYDTTNAMLNHGGSFAKALAHAATQADPDNLQRLKLAFPELWEKYAAMAGEKAASV